MGADSWTIWTFLKTMKTLIKLTLMLALFVGLRGVADAQYGFLCDSNGVSLPLFYVPGSNVVGSLNASNLSGTVPSSSLTGVIQTLNTNQQILLTNSYNHAWTFINTNCHFHIVDEYGTTNDFTTNGFTITWTNGNQIVLSNGNISLTGQYLGNGTNITNINSANIYNWLSISNQMATNYWTPLMAASNVLSGLIYSTSNLLWSNTAALVLSDSNLLQLQITAAGVNLLNCSNVLQSEVLSSSNALQAQIITQSNRINMVTGIKSFASAVTSGYACLLYTSPSPRD